MAFVCNRVATVTTVFAFHSEDLQETRTVVIAAAELGAPPSTVVSAAFSPLTRLVEAASLTDRRPFEDKALAICERHPGVACSGHGVQQCDSELDLRSSVGFHHDPVIPRIANDLHCGTEKRKRRKRRKKGQKLQPHGVTRGQSTMVTPWMRPKHTSVSPSARNPLCHPREALWVVKKNQDSSVIPRRSVVQLDHVERPTC